MKSIKHLRQLHHRKPVASLQIAGNCYRWKWFGTLSKCIEWILDRYYNRNVWRDTSLCTCVWVQLCKLRWWPAVFTTLESIKMNKNYCNNVISVYNLIYLTLVHCVYASTPNAADASNRQPCDCFYHCIASFHTHSSRRFDSQALS